MLDGPSLFFRVPTLAKTSPFEQRTDIQRLEAPLQPVDAAERDHFHPLRVVAGIPAFIDSVI